MARLQLQKINGQWWLVSKSSGKVLANNTEKTQMLLRYLGSNEGEFMLEVA